jgi:predicted double-glycine peptidase
MEFREGDIVEGKEREKRHMKVVQLVNRSTVILEYFDEQGKQTITVPLASVRFVADQETQEYIAPRNTWFHGMENFKKTNEAIKREKERKRRSKMGKDRRGFISGNHGNNDH